MAKKNVLALGLLISVVVANAAAADTGHGHDAETKQNPAAEMGMQNGTSQMGMMGGDRHAMMRSMMQMHAASMMCDEMGMMDRDMTAMMMMSGVGQHSVGETVSAQLQEFDADNDDALTLEEFENLHTATIRERMVDRFQHLDADGDGKITKDEIDAAGTRFGAMANEPGRTRMEGR